jgi:hypothetical protein
MIPTNKHITAGVKRALKMLRECPDYDTFEKVLPFARHVERVCRSRGRWEDSVTLSTSVSRALLRVT